jgi:hypothetical protein
MRQTILLEDGYTGKMIRCYAQPIAHEGSMVKLQVAEPGKEYMIRWAFRVVVEKLASRPEHSATVLP